MGRASPLLASRSIGASALVLGALLAYYFAAASLPEIPLWWEVALLASALIPAVFSLVWLALPLQRARGLVGLAVALGVLAVLAELGDLEVIANFAKLGAACAFAFWFLELFQELAWVALVAVIVPWVDAYSVWRGPTGDIVENHPGVFETLSFAFRLPGEHSAAHLGLPDLLFFALFAAAASRFGLRPGWTWLAMVAGLGATIALAVWTDAAGLPALPALSVGFLVPNADRIWASLRRLRRPR